jgi:hypothetical protein
MPTKGNGGGAAEGLRKRLEQLTQRANAGDRQALADLRAFLDEHPEVEEHIGDLARLAERHWIAALAGDDALLGETVKRRIVHLKEALAGPNPSEVERLVVGLVAVNHLAERHAADPSTKSIEQAAFRLKRAESAQRRYLASIKMLAQMRAILPHGLAPEGNPTPGGGLRIYDAGAEAA